MKTSTKPITVREIIVTLNRIKKDLKSHNDPDYRYHPEIYCSRKFTKAAESEAAKNGFRLKFVPGS